MAEPLSLSSYSLMANTLITAGLGLVFWVVAARLLGSDAVGRDSALVTAMMTLSAIGQLNLANALVRFLARTGDRAGRTIVGAYALAIVASCLLAVGFVLGAPHVSSRFAFLSQDRLLSLGFVAGVVLWGVFALQDAVLTALRSAPWVPLENGLFGVLKMAALPALAAAGVAHAVFIGWVIPMVMLLAPVNYVIFARALPRYRARQWGAHSIVEHFTRRRLLRFLGQDYLGSLVGMATTLALPVCVVALLGGKANAYFFMPYTVISSFELMFGNVTTSLTVEGALDERRIGVLARRVMRRLAVISIGGGLLIVLAAPLVLAPFGPAYVAHGAGVLRVLACATVFRAVGVLYLAIQRLRGRGLPIVYTTLWRALALIGLTLTLGPRMGIMGVAVAWVAAAVPVALVVAPGLLRLLRTAEDGPQLESPLTPAARPSEAVAGR